MNKTSAGWVKALGVGLLLLSGGAVAQQHIGNSVYICNGAAQAGPCQPQGDDDDYGSSGSSSGGYTDNDYAHAEPQWADRWGAIADDGNGIAGIVASKKDKREAEESALADCKKRGGAGCTVRLAYYNQCAAVAASTSKSFTQGSPTKDEAEKRALERCNNSENECWIYYSGCSLQERVQ